MADLLDLNWTYIVGSIRTYYSSQIPRFRDEFELYCSAWPVLGRGLIASQPNMWMLYLPKSLAVLLSGDGVCLHRHGDVGHNSYYHNGSHGEGIFQRRSAQMCVIV